MYENEIIIQLISADIKYHRFTNYLYKNHLVPDEFELDLLSIVALKMGERKGEIRDNWIECYMSFLDIAIEDKNIPSETIALLMYYQLKAI